MKYNFYLFVLFAITLLINHTNQEEINVKEVLNKIKEMFYFGYDNYMKYAFPRDELRPISCSGVDSFGSLTITLIDTLDTLAIFSNKSEFTKQVEWICSEIKSFDKDVNISVFETNIRVLGGLLSSHMLAMDKNLGLMEVDYSGCLLNLAEDLAKRLMPAFEKTKTGIPYGTVNLRHGVPPEETKITSVAGAGSYSMEFGVLSRLTGDNSYEAAAVKAVQHIYDKKSRLGLLGNHIDIESGNWTHRDAGIGANVDSYYEYLLKSAILFGDRKYFDLFVPLYESALTHLKKGEWYIEVEMESGIMTWPIFSTLQGFWPGLQVLYGDILQASKTMKSFMNIFKKNGFSPEGYNLASDNVQQGREGYPLRPELAESLYYLYQATKDSTWRSYGLDILHSIDLMTRTKCGFARVENVQKMTLSDLMDSFFLSETLKYLFLLFDEDNFVNKQNSYIFTTEAHIFDVSYFSEFPPLSNLSLHSKSSNCRFSNYQNLLSSNGFNIEYLPKKPVEVPQPAILNNIPANLKFDEKMNTDEAKEAINKLLSNLNINGKDVKIKFNAKDVSAQFQDDQQEFPNIEVSDNSFVDVDSINGGIVNEDSQFIVSNTDEYIQIDSQDLDIHDFEQFIDNANVQQIKMDNKEQNVNENNKNYDDTVVLPKFTEVNVDQNQNTIMNELSQEDHQDNSQQQEESDHIHSNEEKDHHHVQETHSQEDSYQNEVDHLDNSQQESHQNHEEPSGNHIVVVEDIDAQSGDLPTQSNDMHLHTHSVGDLAQENPSQSPEK